MKDTAGHSASLYSGMTEMSSSYFAYIYIKPDIPSGADHQLVKCEGNLYRKGHLKLSNIILLWVLCMKWTKLTHNKEVVSVRIFHLPKCIADFSDTVLGSGGVHYKLQG